MVEPVRARPRARSGGGGAGLARRRAAAAGRATHRGGRAGYLRGQGRTAVDREPAGSAGGDGRRGRHPQRRRLGDQRPARFPLLGVVGHRDRRAGRGPDPGRGHQRLCRQSAGVCAHLSCPGPGCAPRRPGRDLAPVAGTGCPAHPRAGAVRSRRQLVRVGRHGPLAAPDGGGSRFLPRLRRPRLDRCRRQHGCPAGGGAGRRPAPARAACRFRGGRVGTADGGGRALRPHRRLLAPALAEDDPESCRAVVGDLDRQRAHVARVLRPVRDALSTVADALEQALCA